MNKRLKILRAQLGMSQKQFGEKLHLSVSQISSYENNYRNIPERTICDIIREFNVNPKWIRFGLGNIFNKDVNSTHKLVEKINMLSEDDQKFVLKIINCLYDSSIENKTYI